ncbi:hypothetical protein KWG22_18935 [Acinetobacter pittii]|uniref:hypothetical protein n=1 Tax=Acinetobacter pittii TaxID=48296 RepID=UPI00355B200B
MAKKLIKAPSHSTHANADYQYYSNSLDKEWCAYDDVSDVWVFENPDVRSIVNIANLKSLVESLDFVQTYGGIVMAKRQLDLFLRVNLEQGTTLSITVSKLKDAVADYESIFPPKCIHGYDVACLICGFGTLEGERVYRNIGKTL